MSEIDVKGFVLLCNGDSSVGIEDSTWTVEGGFIFESNDELSTFKKELASVFESYAGSKVKINTYEEIDEMNKTFCEPQEARHERKD